MHCCPQTKHACTIIKKSQSNTKNVRGWHDNRDKKIHTAYRWKAMATSKFKPVVAVFPFRDGAVFLDLDVLVLHAHLGLADRHIDGPDWPLYTHNHYIYKNIRISGVLYCCNHVICKRLFGCPRLSLSLSLWCSLAFRKWRSKTIASPCRRAFEQQHSTIWVLLFHRWAPHPRTWSSNCNEHGRQHSRYLPSHREATATGRHREYCCETLRASSWLHSKSSGLLSFGPWIFSSQGTSQSQICRPDLHLYRETPPACRRKRKKGALLWGAP